MKRTGVVFIIVFLHANGKKYDGELTYREFKKIIEDELRNAKTQ